VEENRNHLTLAKFHIALAIVYITLFATIMIIVSNNNYTHRPLLMLYLFLLFFLHAFLAIGSRKKMEISRKISVAVGVLMLAVFPVGTIFSFYFLPYTEWKNVEEESL